VDLIRYVVKAVVLEGPSVREVAAAHGVSRSWVSECLARYRAEATRACIRGRGGP
jgi:transposase